MKVKIAYYIKRRVMYFLLPYGRLYIDVMEVLSVSMSVGICVKCDPHI